MDKDKLYELTTPQMNIWNTEQYFSGTSINNICGSIYIKCPIDFTTFEKAVRLVFNSHDNFKLSFKIVDNTPYQLFSNNLSDIRIDTIEIKNKLELSSIEKQIAKTPFSILSNRLFNIKFYKYPDSTGGAIICIHHLISDSWTLGLICHEVISTYKKLLKKEDTISVSYSYSDFISKEHEYLESDNFIKDKNYWNDLFKTIPGIASIPSSLKSNLDSTCVASRKSFNIPNKLLERITFFCKSNNVSLYNFLISIFSIYISRVSNLDDFVIGTPILNRLNYIDKNTNGMFVSTVPLRVSIQNNKSFIAFSQSIAQSSISMLRHQRYPYSYILRDLRKNNSNIPNLYNIVFSYQITKLLDDEIPSESHWIFNGNSADDLQIHVMDYNNSGSLNILYDYKRNKYTASDIQSIHNRIYYMIEQVVSNFDINVSDIEIVTESEKKQLLYEFNDTTVDFPKDKTIVDLFEEQVEKTPNNVALVFENQRLTYKELNEKSNQLARYLIENGVKSGDVVGIRLDKSLELIIGILAIIKAGGVYLPINMFYPQERVEYMLSDSNAAFFITSSQVNTFFSMKIPTIFIDLNVDNIYNDYSVNNLNVKINPENLLYIIYTSGSTGKPKGAMVCHRNVTRLFINSKPLYDFSSNDVWTMFHSVAFDFSVWEMYGALLFGGKLILISDTVAKDTNLFLDLLRTEKVTVLNQTPTYFYNLSNSEMDRPDSGLSLRYIIFGGEALKPNLTKKWHLKYPQVKLINMYGITETTVHVTYKKLEEKDFSSTKSNIGRPIPTLQVLILDKYLHLLPCGTPGEMCVFGAGVFKGYLNRPDLNSQKLVFSKIYNQVLYRSGDNAVLHSDGNLEYLGRIDKQVKLRGFRVELGEIEEKILSNSSIKSCVVVKKVDNNNRDILCAYYIKNSPINVKKLEETISKELPYYMVPQYFVEIDNFPTNINGKIDINSLPIPTVINERKEIVPPRNFIDTAIISSFKRILKIKNISISDSFYDLGGDSLSAIAISSLLSKKLDFNISVKEILDNPIIYKLSDFIFSNINSTNISPIESMTHVQANNSSLSFAQKRIYYATKIAGENNLVYNTSVAFLIDSVLDSGKLEDAFKEIIIAQSSFRTEFYVESSEIKQRILNKVDFSIPVSYSSIKNIDSLVNNFAKPFDLSHAPLLRVSLCYLDNNQTLLMIDSHHIIMDGVSLHILLDELFKIYNNNGISHIKLDYSDYSIYEQKYLSSSTFDLDEKYWLNKFNDYSFDSLNLPYDYSLTACKKFCGKKIHTNFTEDDFAKVFDFAKGLKVSPYVVFLTALYIELYRYTGQSDIVIGSPAANRELPEFQDIIGMFVNNLSLRLKILPNQSIAKLINFVQSSISDDLKHQQYPYDLLVKNLHVPTDNSRNPLFDIVFTYQNPMNKYNIPSLKIMESNNLTSKFNITFEVSPETHEINAEYRTDLFKFETINSFIEHYKFILNQIISNPLMQLNDVNIITPKEKDLLLSFNNTSCPISSKCASEIFEEQVLLNPNNIALICNDISLTYDDLNKKANSLAFYLKSHGIKSNDIVAIMTNRSLETVVCMLAILKAGAAFLNIDPNYPQDRTTYYIENSKIEFVLTQASLHDKVSFIKNCIDIDLDISSIYSKNMDNLGLHINNDDLSYIIYTSGSTGLPKGVMLTQLGLSNMVQAMTYSLDYLKERK